MHYLLRLTAVFLSNRDVPRELHLRGDAGIPKCLRLLHILWKRSSVPRTTTCCILRMSCKTSLFETNRANRHNGLDCSVLASNITSTSFSAYITTIRGLGKSRHSRSSTSYIIIFDNILPFHTMYIPRSSTRQVPVYPDSSQQNAVSLCIVPTSPSRHAH